jgi:hypothetical protein
MKSIRAILLAVLLILLLAPIFRVYATDTPLLDQWMGIYQEKEKIGFCHITICKDRFESKDVYRRDYISGQLMGQEDSQYHRSYTNSIYVDANYSPIFQTWKIADSNGNSWTVEARYNLGTIKCKSEHNGKTTTKNTPIPKNTDVSTYFKCIFGAAELAIGDTLESNWLYWNDLSLHKFTVKVHKKESIETKLGKYNTLIVTKNYHMSKNSIDKIWLTDNGGYAKEISEEDGTESVLEKEDDAPYSTSKPEIPITSLIKNSLKVIELKLHINGIYGISVVPDDSRQTSKRDLRNQTVDYHIIARTFSPPNSTKLPINKEGYEDWLGDSASVETSHPLIQETARQIIGDETNAYVAACKISGWINRNIGTDGFVPNSALAILKAKAGVCRHKSYLFAAFARAVGIPTKVVSGLVYSDDGFYHHAWVECFVGDWVPFEAAWYTFPVDATHIKLIEDDSLGSNIYGTKDMIAEAVECWYEPIPHFNCQINAYDYCEDGIIKIGFPTGRHLLIATQQPDCSVTVQSDSSVDVKLSNGNQTTLSSLADNTKVIVLADGTIRTEPPTATGNSH